MMKLESLANELLLDLFEFFTTMHLLQAFSGLNSRFESLLFTQFRVYRLDFRFVSKCDFDILCDQYLPWISDRTIALRLSNDDETPQQIESFLLRDNLFQQFTHLKAFSLHQVFSEEIMQSIAVELKQFPSLIHLKVTECCLPSDEMDMLSFINNIWSLRKLIYFNLDIYSQNEQNLITPTMISSSIQYVSIKGILFDFNELTLLFEHTPSIRYLEMHNNCLTEDVDLTTSVPLLTTLNLSFSTFEKNAIVNLLQNMFNLRRLTIDICGVCIDGNQWEQIIRNSLPYLRIFQLKEQFCLVGDQDQGDRKVDTLVKSFQTRFWLEERKWYIQCDWNLADTYSFISLFTLPYSFDEFTVDDLLTSKSTYPKNDKQELYSRVHKLQCNASSFDDTPSFQTCFSNFQHLTVELPVHDHFWFMIPKLDQLISLNISLSDVDVSVSQLQILLDQATNLRSLTINSLPSSLVMPFIENTNVSIRRLDLQGNDQWFDNNQCIALIKSPLGLQCEMLAIDIKECNSVIDIVSNMINLRALKVRCEDDNLDYNLLLEDTDDFVKWLRSCLPSTCIITRDIFSINDVHSWIR